MNRRSFFKLLPAMPVAAVAASKMMAEEPKSLRRYEDWLPADNWLVGPDRIHLSCCTCANCKK